MREILFRGKPKSKTRYDELKKYLPHSCWDGFVFGSLICKNDSYYICLKLEHITSALLSDNGICTLIEVIPSTVGQCIGFDNNGQRIFEGDIVKDAEGDTYIVEWVEEYLCFAFTNKQEEVDCNGTFLGDLVVVGNIYDNPELLRKE